ncbi:MAG TPA: hypothetical protein VNL98_10595, partial [Gemmatimonadales bacterium]|nr:hypothetical protein [Gemmatimonadales bacterium]
MGLFAALFLVSCFGEPTGPELRRGRIALAPRFQNPLAPLLVDFDRVRIRLDRVGAGGTALDTLVLFPPDSNSISLDLTVPVEGTRQNFTVTLALINAAGDTV